MGTEDATEALESYEKLEALVGKEDGIASKSRLIDWLMEKGQALFEKTWAAIKDTVCYIHREGLNIDDNKTLAKYLAAAVVAAGSVTNALAVLVVSIAVKNGLDNMCPAD